MNVVGARNQYVLTVTCSFAFFWDCSYYSIGRVRRRSGCFLSSDAWNCLFLHWSEVMFIDSSQILHWLKSHALNPPFFSCDSILTSYSTSSYMTIREKLCPKLCALLLTPRQSLLVITSLAQLSWVPSQL